MIVNHNWPHAPPPPPPPPHRDPTRPTDLLVRRWFYIGAEGEEDANATSWFDQARIVKECNEHTWPPSWAVEDAHLDYGHIVCEPTSQLEMYLIAFYWAITVLSTVGYGDISANNSTERLFSSVVALLGCFLFAILIGSLGSALMSERILDSKVERQVCGGSSGGGDCCASSILYVSWLV
jgi:hypothetical protein